MKSNNELEINREIKKAEILFKKGKFLEAKNCLNGLIGGDSIAKNFLSLRQKLKIRLLLGWTHIELKEFSKAKEQFESILKVPLLYQRHLVMWGMAISCINQNIEEADRYLVESFKYKPRCFSKYHLKRHSEIYLQRGSHYFKIATMIVESVYKFEGFLDLSARMYGQYERISGEKIDLPLKLSQQDSIGRIAKSILYPGESLVFFYCK